MVKLCARCKTSKLATPEYFYRNSQSPDGLHSYCKVCKSNIHKVYMSDPTIRLKISLQVRAWQKGVGKDKYIKTQKKYEASFKKALWRRTRDNAKPRVFKNKPVLYPLAVPKNTLDRTDL